ncbi:MAG: hypothetical protein NBV68_04405 [Erythrobacter sp.]|nr:hypothetical protein [Erythrobacter sp.]
MLTDICVLPETVLVRMTEMGSIAGWRDFSRNGAKPSFAAGLEPWRLPPQTQSFPSVNGNGCFRPFVLNLLFE